MNDTFPYAQRDPGAEHYQMLSDIELPDEGDRHVVAAALAADAPFICTNNVRGFPSGVLIRLGLAVITPDDLLSQLVRDYPASMLWVHEYLSAIYMALLIGPHSPPSEVPLLSGRLISWNKCSLNLVRCDRVSISDPARCEPALRTKGSLPGSSVACGQGLVDLGGDSLGVVDPDYDLVVVAVG